MIDSMLDYDGPSKILIVDDSCTDVRYLNHLLQNPLLKPAQNPYEIKSVNTASVGLETWRMWSPHCILLDYVLPDMTGLQFLEEINGDLLASTTSADPLAIVMLTGAGDENTAVQAMKLGVSDYLVKGAFTGSELTQTIHQAYEKAELLFELEQRRNELALFADRLAHDMVTPLHSLGLHVELLAELLSKSNSEPAILKNLKTIDGISNQLSEFVQHLYDYTTVGRNEIEFEPVNLNDIAKHTLNLLETELQQKNVSIQLDTLPVVKGCYIDLLQLMQNLVSNAIKYSDKSETEIHFSARRISDKFWEIKVSDNGIGIQKQDLEMIFEPFKRTSSARGYQGSGLGLSTCRKIVESHGGKIWADSTPGSGLSIHFLLSSNSASSFI